MRRGSLSLLVAIAIALASPRAARADTETCLAAYDAGQRLRGETKLRAAEAQLIACAQDGCPAELRRDCLGWLDEVRKSLPSLVVQVVAQNGCDLVEGKVLIDGELVAERLDGKALELDPGVHTVRIEDGTTGLEQRVVLGEGEKNRRVSMTFAAGAICGSAPPRSTGVGMAPRPEPVAPGRPISTLTYVLGGIGIAGLAVSSGFYASGWSQKGTLDSCRPSCSRGDVDSMSRTFVIGDVLLALGVVSLGAAAILSLTR